MPLHCLPEDLRAKVVAYAAEAGVGSPQAAARKFATLAQVNRAFHGAVDAALHTHVEVSYATSAARLAQAANGAMQDQRDEWVDTPRAQRLDRARVHMAAAIRGLDHVRVDLGPVHSPEVAKAVVDALAGQGGLRSLEIALPADFHALPALMELLATRPGILRRLELRATAQPDTPVPGLDPAGVARMLQAQKDTLTALKLSNTGFRLEPPLSNAIASLSGLQSLKLSGMPLGAGQTQALADTLRPLQLLQDLDLSHSRHAVAACEQLMGVLENHPRLSHLNLGSNLLGNDGAQVLAPRLATLARLESLDLSDNDIGLEGCRAVAAQLILRVRRHTDPQFATSLRHLSLAGNALGDATAEHLVQALAEIPLLHELNLRGCQFGPIGMGKLGPALKKMTQLQILNLQSNQLGQNGHSSLADALRALPNLQDLNLRGTSLGADGLAALKDALVELKQLHTLNLGHNPLNHDGCDALAPILEKLTQLQTLNLAAIAPDATDGLKSLGRALSRLDRLQHLDLSDNACPNGARLAGVLRRVGGELKTLGLEHMSVNLDRWQGLADALMGCIKLRELNLGNNQLTPHIVGQLTPALAGLQHLEVLGLHENELSRSSLSALLSDIGGLRKLRSVTVSGYVRPNDLKALQDVLPHVHVS